MRRELEETVRRKLKDQALDALLKANKLDLPKALVDDEIERLRHDALVRIGVRDSKKASELPRELFEEQAVKRVSLGLLVGEIINQQQLGGGCEARGRASGAHGGRVQQACRGGAQLPFQRRHHASGGDPGAGGPGGGLAAGARRR